VQHDDRVAVSLAALVDDEHVTAADAPPQAAALPLRDVHGPTLAHA
jgi:hypothetical protein